MRKFQIVVFTFLAALLTAGCWAAPAIDTEIVTAIEALDPADDGAWTKDGRPRVRALEASLGRDISGADRDLAFGVWQACAPDRERAAFSEARAIDAETRAEAAEAADHAARTEREAAVTALAEWRARARSAERSADAAVAAALDADHRAEAAQAKTAALLAGRRVCLDERAAVGAHLDDWFAGDLSVAGAALLDCLAGAEP